MVDSSAFSLHKSAFKNVLLLRYDWPINNQPCGHTFCIDKTLSCTTGVFPSISRHYYAILVCIFFCLFCYAYAHEESIIKQ